MSHGTAINAGAWCPSYTDEKPTPKKKRVFDKAARRSVRANARVARSKFESKLYLLRRADAEAKRLATNSHERARYVLADRQERKRGGR